MDQQHDGVTEENLQGMSVKALKSFITLHGGSIEGITEKSELRDRAKDILGRIRSAAPKGTAGEEETDPITREIDSSTSTQIANLLSARVSTLAGGLTVRDIPPVPSKVCGRLFQEGDLAYNCRTCESDETCVQCRQCFEKSNHEGHEVLFHKAGIGGCCDCGDVEAWATEGCCSEHGPNATNVVDDPVSLVPPALAISFRSVFRGCVKYVNMLIKEEVMSYHLGLVSSAVVPGEPGDVEGEAFHVLMHNDDVHTYDDVIQVLSDTTMAHVADAEEATTAIDKLGRCSIHQATSLSAAQTAVNHFRPSGLLLSIATPALLEKEKKAIAIVTWLKKTCESSPALARILIQEFCARDETNAQSLARQWLRETFSGDIHLASEPDTILGTLLKVHALIPKLLIKQFQELFLRCLVDERFRTELGVAMGDAICLLARQYSHGLGVKTYTLLDLDVQLFTVKSVATEFRQRYGKTMALVTTQACADFFKASLGGDGKIDFLHHSIHYQRYHPFFQTLRYQLRLGLFEQQTGEEVQSTFIELIDHVLARATGIHSLTRRQETDHVAYEDPTFQDAFNLDITLSGLIDNAIDALEELKSNHRAALAVFKYAIAAIQPDSRFQLPISKGLLPFSFHLPLHRFCGLLGRRLMMNQDGEDQDLFARLDFNPIILMDRPSRTITASAQIFLGMWRRDGINVLSQMRSYSALGRMLFYDLDLFTLQMSWARCIGRDGVKEGTEMFLEFLFKRFEIRDWFISKHSEDTLTIRVALLEELCRLIITLLSALPPSGEEDVKAVVRKAIIHILAMAPSGGVNFSEIAEELETERLLLQDEGAVKNGALSESEVLNVLASCSKHVESPNGETRYEMLPDSWLTEFDPFYWHLDRAEMEGATERREKQIALVLQSRKFSSPIALTPKPLKAARAVSFVHQSLASMSFVLTLIRRMLEDAVKANPLLQASKVRVVRSNHIEQLEWADVDMKTSAGRTSPGCLRACLHLLTIILHNSDFLTDSTPMVERGDGSLNVVESIIALRSVSNLAEAEGSGIEWIYQHLSNLLEPIDARVAMLVGELRHEEAARKTEPEKKVSRKRAMDAQNSMMERMRRAQQAAVKNLLDEDDQMEVEKNESATTFEDDENDSLTCALCRSKDDPKLLGFFAFSETSTWDRIEVTKPTILSRPGPPMGWTPPPPSSATSVNSASSPAATTGGATLDWGMSDIEQSSAAQAQPGGHAQGPFDEDDADDIGDDDDEEGDDDVGFNESAEMMIEAFGGGFTQIQTQLEAMGASPAVGGHAEASASDLPPLVSTEPGAPRCEDCIVMQGHHGQVPGRTFLRSCGHAVHLTCFNDYMRRPRAEANDSARFAEFQCSVCRQMSKCIILAGSSKPIKVAKALPEVDPDWNIDWENSLMMSSPVSSSHEETTLDSIVKRKPVVRHFAGLQSLAFSWEIPVDASASKSKTVMEVLREQLKSRRESLAVFYQFARGATAKIGKDENQTAFVDSWRLFLQTGKSNENDLARLLTSASANVASVETMETEIHVPTVVHEDSIRHITNHSSLGLFGTLGITKSDGHLVYTVPDSQEQWIIFDQLHKGPAEGRRVEELRSVPPAELSFVLYPHQPRMALLLDVADPFELFCCMVGLGCEDLTERRLKDTTKLIVALALVQQCVRPRDTLPEMNGTKVTAIEALLQVKRPDLISRNDELEIQLSALMLQLANAHGLLLGPRWIETRAKVTGEDLSLKDGKGLWTLLGLPLPNPFEEASEISVAGLEPLWELVRPWLEAVRDLPMARYRSLRPKDASLHFVDLPQRYDALYSLVMSKGVCYTRGVSPPKEPALCLLCGDVVCAGATCCKRASPSVLAGLLFSLTGQQGAGLASNHVHASSGNGGGDTVGVFLLVQRAQCLLMFGGRGISVPAPYLDAHGNPDPFLRKGRPLTLSIEKYEAIQRQVAEHRMASHVARTRNSANEVIFVNYF